MTRTPRLTTLRPRVQMATPRIAPRPKQADAELLTPEHRAWRRAVLDRAGWRCEWIEDGKRCEASAATGDRMFADHVVERADGGALLDPANGCVLCGSHHVRKTNRARAQRHGMGGLKS
jgi:5-methylcytosine-specific restriction protein A